MSAGTAGQIVTVWIIVGIPIALLLGKYLKNRRTRNDFHSLLSKGRIRPERPPLIRRQSPGISRLELLEAERRDIARDTDNHAFALDEPSHPHPKDAA